jgi:hypothetical protein
MFLNIKLKRKITSISFVGRALAFIAIAAIMITNIDFDSLFEDGRALIRIDSHLSSAIKLIFAGFYMYYKTLFDDVPKAHKIIDNEF